MSTLTLDVKYDDSAVQKALARVLRATGNARPLMQDIGEYLTPVHEDRWERETDPDGRPWAPLKPETLKRKKTTRILYEEGDLLRGAIYNASATQLEFGLNDWKAAFHQFGTSRGLPAREMLGLDADDEQEILDIIADYLADALK